MPIDARDFIRQRMEDEDEEEGGASERARQFIRKTAVGDEEAAVSESATQSDDGGFLKKATSFASSVQRRAMSLLPGPIGTIAGIVNGLQDTGIADKLKEKAAESRKSGVLNEVAGAFGAKKYGDPTQGGALRQPTEAERQEYAKRGISLPTAEDTGRIVREQAEKERGTQTFVRNRGMLAEFDYFNQTPEQRVGALVTLPIRWTAGSLARATIGAALEYAGSDAKFIPETRLAESLIGREDLRSWSTASDLYGIVKQSVNAKLTDLGFSTKDAQGASFATTLVLAGLLENPFMKLAGKPGKEALERALKDNIEAGIGREMDDTLLKRISDEAAVMVTLPPETRQKAVQEFLTRVEAETAVKRKMKTVKLQLSNTRKQYLKEAIQGSDELGEALTKGEIKREATQSEAAFKGFREDVFSGIKNNPKFQKEGMIPDSLRDGYLVSKAVNVKRATGQSNFTRFVAIDRADWPKYADRGYYKVGSLDSAAHEAGFDDAIDYLEFVREMDDKLSSLPPGSIQRAAHDELIKIDPKYAKLNEQIEALKTEIREESPSLARVGASEESNADETFESLRGRSGITIDEKGYVSPYGKADEVVDAPAAKVVDTKEARVELDESVYLANRSMAAKKKRQIFGKDVMSGAKKKAEQFLTSISMRLENIDPSLKTALRKLEFNVSRQATADLKVADPFLKRLKKMRAEDVVDLDLAMKNGDTKKITEIADRYNMVGQADELRTMLNDLHKRANSAGYDIGYEKGYFPRIVKNADGLMKYLGKDNEIVSLIEEAVQQKVKDLDRLLTYEEKAQVANMLIRGYQQGKITLGKKGNMLARQIDIIDGELNQFYYSSFEALPRYLNQMNEAIEAKKFFGGTLKGLDSMDNPNIKDSVGAYTLNLVADGKIKPEQELELREILQARFAATGPGEIIGLYRDVAYIEAMGNFSSAISQLQDLYNSLYRTGVFPTMKNASKSLVNKSTVSVADLGLEKVAQEFSNPGKVSSAVRFIFKMVGIEKLDRLGKETFVNSILSKYKKLAAGPLTEKGELYRRLVKIFPDEKTMGAVVNDLRNGTISEDVKFFLFNEISDIAPVSMSEMPEKYLTGGSGRIFYMLKSYTLKQFEVYRREIVQEAAKGNKVRAMQNAFRLTAYMLLMGATADEIKAWMYNRETMLEDPSVWKDRLIDGTLRLFGMSKFSTYKLRDGDIGGFLSSLILPPTDFVTNIYKDAKTLWSSPDVTSEFKDLESVRAIPVAGKLYYWWWGKGGGKTEDAQEDRRIDDNVKRIIKIYETQGEAAAEAEYKAVKAEVPDLIEDIKRKVQDEAMGLTRQEKKLREEGVTDGSRAQIVYKKLMRLDSDEEKNALVADYKKKKIITDKVFKQLKYLIENDGVIPEAGD
jgi:hypothetical protein